MVRYEITLPNKETLITPKQMSRTMFCMDCAEAKAPQIDDEVLLYKTNSEKKIFSKIREEASVGYWGYTPHLIEDIVIDRTSNIVTYTKTCGMFGCGYSIVEMVTENNPEENQKEIIVLNSTKGAMELADFIAFINFKDPSFYVRVVDMEGL